VVAILRLQVLRREEYPFGPENRWQVSHILTYHQNSGACERPVATA
jgi:hypothetical protein